MVHQASKFFFQGIKIFYTIKGVSSIERGLGYQSLNKQREFSKDYSIRIVKRLQGDIIDGTKEARFLFNKKR